MLELSPHWAMADALIGGTLEMREKGELYLPRWPNEEKTATKKRIACATLLPAFSETVANMTGRAFRAPLIRRTTYRRRLRPSCRCSTAKGVAWIVW